MMLLNLFKKQNFFYKFSNSKQHTAKLITYNDISLFIKTEKNPYRTLTFLGEKLEIAILSTNEKKELKQQIKSYFLTHKNITNNPSLVSFFMKKHHQILGDFDSDFITYLADIIIRSNNMIENGFVGSMSTFSKLNYTNPTLWKFYIDYLIKYSTKNFLSISMYGLIAILTSLMRIGKTNEPVFKLIINSIVNRSKELYFNQLAIISHILVKIKDFENLSKLEILVSKLIKIGIREKNNHLERDIITLMWCFSKSNHDPVKTKEVFIFLLDFICNNIAILKSPHDVSLLMTILIHYYKKKFLEENDKEVIQKTFDKIFPICSLMIVNKNLNEKNLISVIYCLSHLKVYSIDKIKKFIEIYFKNIDKENITGVFYCMHGLKFNYPTIYNENLGAYLKIVKSHNKYINTTNIGYVCWSIIDLKDDELWENLLKKISIFLEDKNLSFSQFVNISTSLKKINRFELFQDKILNLFISKDPSQEKILIYELSFFQQSLCQTFPLESNPIVLNKFLDILNYICDNLNNFDEKKGISYLLLALSRYYLLYNNDKICVLFEKIQKNFINTKEYLNLEVNEFYLIWKSFVLVFEKNELFLIDLIKFFIKNQSDNEKIMIEFIKILSEEKENFYPLFGKINNIIKEFWVDILIKNPKKIHNVISVQEMCSYLGENYSKQLENIYKNYKNSIK